MLAQRDRDRGQLGDLLVLHGGRVETLALAEDMRAGLTALRPVLDDLVDALERKQRPACALVPGLAPRLRPEAGLGGRGGAEGGSCEGGSEELRELRLRRCSSSATRASSRRFASISSPTRSRKATAASRSPSRIASAWARSRPTQFAAPSEVPAYRSDNN